MSDDASSAQGPFDLERLKELIEMMEKHGLTEVTLRRGDEKWSLRRGPQETFQAVPTMAPSPMPAAPVAAPPTAAEPAPAAPTESAEAGVEIKSPTVGTFYSSPSPDEPPFISVGTAVQPDTVVCVVEAMKVFNQIPAETSGTITEILVNDGDSVEFGQPLFRVRPA
jgi:acetyl-CoA carboxylase biotin carboxyl carrier protein